MPGITTSLVSTPTYIAVDILSSGSLDLIPFTTLQGKYKVIMIVNRFGNVHGASYLQLHHIADPRLRPPDQFFRDHFLQGVLKHMKGVGEPTWDNEANLGNGAFELSKHEIWGNIEGQKRLELELAIRLFGHQVTQDLDV